jgi:hypothetical protein
MLVPVPVFAMNFGRDRHSAGYRAFLPAGLAYGSARYRAYWSIRRHSCSFLCYFNERVPCSFHRQLCRHRAGSVPSAPAELDFSPARSRAISGSWQPLPGAAADQPGVQDWYILHPFCGSVYSKNNTRFRSYPTFIGSRDSGVPVDHSIKPILSIERPIWQLPSLHCID